MNASACGVKYLPMSKPRMMYFEENDEGELISIGILDASQFVRDFVLEVAQAKMLKWPPQATQSE